MIEYPNIEKGGRRNYFLSQLVVGLTGFAISRGVVVKKHQCRSLLQQSRLEKQTHIDKRRRRAALTYAQCIDDTIGRIEQNHPKLFLRQIGQLGIYPFISRVFLET